MQATIHVCDVAYRYRWLFLIAVAVAVGFFEWTCKSENKTSIRTFILVGVTLVSVVSAFWVAAVTMISFGLLPS